MDVVALATGSGHRVRAARWAESAIGALSEAACVKIVT
jgi:hypothetical protein